MVGRPMIRSRFSRTRMSSALTRWLVLLFVPSNRAVVEGVARALVPSLLSIAYAVILIPFLSAAASDRWKAGCIT